MRLPGLLLLCSNLVAGLFSSGFSENQGIFEPILGQDSIPANMGLLSDKEYEPAPSNLKLEQVHVYVRHGERTPVGIRMSEPPASIPAFWNACKTARRFKAAVMGGDNVTEGVEILRLSERSDGYAQEGECLPGELTDTGRKVFRTLEWKGSYPLMNNSVHTSVRGGVTKDLY
ncbi:hypothetical protein ACGC1H_002286 [Rhizoctonia solani]